MATYFTKSEARASASGALRKSATKDSKRILRESVTAASDLDQFDVFLSHATKDAELILGVKSLLQDMGLSVYVDWIDDAQLDHAKVSRENADLLRRRMRQSKSLIWVATEAASNSKWMPWELGYFDGFRPDQVAVLPLVDSGSENFKGQEYLSLYPVVRKDRYSNTGEADVFVEDVGNNKWEILKKFGKGATYWRPYGA